MELSINIPGWLIYPVGILFIIWCVTESIKIFFEIKLILLKRKERIENEDYNKFLKMMEEDDE